MMVSMDDRVAIGAMIHQQRALLTRCDERLVEIAREMPYAGRERRRLRMRARVLKQKKAALAHGPKFGDKRLWRRTAQPSGDSTCRAA